MRALLKRFLTWLGGILPESLVWQLHMAGKYVHVGWWIKEHDFSCDVRVRNREQLIEAIARPIADKQILYLEFGVYQGGTMRQWLKWLKNPNSKFRGFDSFEGLPEDWSLYLKKGDISAGGIIPNIPDERVRFIKGWIEDTLPAYTMEEHEVLVVFMDTDLYSATYFVLKHLQDYFKVGTLFYFDEFAVLEHELQAFDNFMRESGMKFELIAADYSLMHVAFRRIA